MVYMAGKDVPKDTKLGLKWLTKAANGGNKRAQYVVGFTLAQKKDASAQDMAQGLEYLKKSAAQNYDKSQLILGFMHFHGKGLEKDESKAAALYYRAAEQGNEQAAERYARMAENGSAENLWKLGPALCGRRWP